MAEPGNLYRMWRQNFLELLHNWAYIKFFREKLQLADFLTKYDWTTSVKAAGTGTIEFEKYTTLPKYE